MRPLLFQGTKETKTLLIYSDNEKLILGKIYLVMTDKTK
jgi:hypothetical protein